MTAVSADLTPRFVFDRYPQTDRNRTKFSRII
jgi:hypothetical protein